MARPSREPTWAVPHKPLVDDSRLLMVLFCRNKTSLGLDLFLSMR
jgi:hypothetical protein